jgi:LmbE family N-acetylglucosaminyl deacetylase
MMDALVVVAHDDDALLWMGGTLLRLNDWHWHVICMCNDNNSKRKNYFKRTCHELKARGDTLDFRDYQAANSATQRNSISDMKQALMGITEGNEYDYVFTHSRDENGEYGHHANHEEVCTAITQLVSGGKLVHFSYSPIYELAGIGTLARRDADYYMQLRYRDLIQKAKLISSHLEPIVANLERDLGAPCPNPEAFEGDELKLPPPFIGR